MIADLARVMRDALLGGNLLTKLGTYMLAPALRRLRKKFDYETYGGAPLLGLRGNCIVTHGRASRNAIKHAIKAAGRRSPARRRRKNQRADRAAFRGNANRSAATRTPCSASTFTCRSAPYLCPYCDFAKWPLRDSSARRYLSALDAEIEREPPARGRRRSISAAERRTRTMPTTIAALVERLARRFRRRARAFDRDQSGARARRRSCALPRAGITRLSIGVQSFEPRRDSDAGTKAHRRAGRSRRRAGTRRGHGFGLARSDVRRAGTDAGELGALADAAHRARGRSHLGLRADRRRGTPYAAWRDARTAGLLATTTREAELYAIAIDVLQAAGYEQYEISNFARPGHRCAHNVNYWANGEYLGFGRRRGLVSRRRALGAHALAGASTSRRRWQGRPIPVGGRAPGGPPARRRGDDARLAHRARGSPERVQRAVRYRRDRRLRSRRDAIRADGAARARLRMRCG